MAEQYRHWKVETHDSGVTVVRVDNADGSTNVFSQQVLEELDGLLTEIERNPPRGVVFASAKNNGFIAGADISMIGQLRDMDDPLALMQQSQSVFDRVENLPCPTVAAIHGFCMGGGLELALACTYRVGDKASASLGLPEVMLGLHPGWGGTVRLPRLIGALQAMPLIMTGRSVKAGPARSMGMLDRIVDRDQLLEAAREIVLSKPAPQRPGVLQRITNWRLLSKPLASQMRKQLRGRARPEHYPAPWAIVDLWEKRPADHAGQLKAEAESFLRLARTDAASGLMRVFFLQDKLKALGKDADFKPKHVHVVGAGTMGGDIAAWCVLRGMTATIQDRGEEYIKPALERARKLYEKKLKSDDKVEEAMRRLKPDVEGKGVADADLVIEAIFENLEAKQKLFAEIEPKLKQGAVMATNTSSIPLDDIASALKNPGKLVGIHFFNPVARMMLVEVVTGEKSDPDEAAKARTFVGAIDRLPLPVRSAPGFLVNRVLMPYLMESVELYAEGVSPTVIDEAAESFGMPMGPVELADTVGLDICHSVGSILSEHLGGGEVPDALSDRVDRGDLGRKTGRGFYEYRDGKPQKPSADMPGKEAMRDMTDRMIYRMLNEAVACLREGVVENEELLDAGMVFGTGFAPFRGGPMNYVRHVGVNKVKTRLAELEKKYGERFRADAGWEKIKE